MRAFQRFVVASTVAFFASASPPAQQQDLLHPTAGNAPQTATRAMIRRSRLVTLDTAALRRIRAGDSLRVELFDGVALTAVFDAPRANDLGGTDWTARFEGRKRSLLTLSEVNGTVSGSAVLGTHLLPRPLTITPLAGGLHAVRELEYANAPCGGGIEPQPTHAPAGTTTGCDTVIRILVLYGRGALADAGGIAPLSTWVVRQVNYLNAVMANSGVSTRFEVANLRELGITSVSSLSAELSRLASTTDGYYDAIHGWRDQYQADLVSLVVADHPAHGNFAGLAYRPASFSSLRPSSGFSVLEFDQGDHVFTHEILHNLGCHHDPANISSGDVLITPYARAKRANQGSGILITKFCTAVGYPNSTYPVIPYLSNPRISYRNSYGAFGDGPTIPLGSATQDQALLVQDPAVWRVVANYRQSTPAPTITAEPADITLCNGYRWGTATFRVTATDASNYQWLKDGQEISGATSATLGVDAEPASCAGSYQCEVWNGCRDNSVFSRVATLSFDPECNNVRYRSGVTGSAYGWSIANVGDYDGDGFDDLAIGAPFALSERGQFCLRSGATGATLASLQGTSGEQLGFSVAGVGDINGDGRDEVLVGAPGYQSNRGRILVLSAAWSSVRTTSGPNATSRFGEIVGRGGDVNADGHPDYLIGAPGDSQVLIYSSETSQRLYTRRLTTTAFVKSVTAGDLDGDGYDDFLIGEPAYDGNAGRVTIVSGRTGSFLVDKRGSGTELLGFSVAGLGDVDGDGIPDYLVGSPNYHSGGLPDVGRAQLFSGRTHTRIRQHVGQQTDGHLGYAVAADTSDPRRGNLPGYVVGAPGERSDGGNAYLFRGSDGRLLQSYGAPDGSQFGRSVAGLRDTGNPTANLVGGMPLYDGKGAVVIAQRGTDNPDPASVRFIGHSCSSSTRTVPHMTFVGRPAIGTSIQLGVQAAQPNRMALLWIDALVQNQALDPFGAPGCELRVVPGTSLLTLTTAQGTASVTIPLPADPGLVGIPLYGQFVLADPAANQLGSTTSDTVRFEFGAR